MNLKKESKVESRMTKEKAETAVKCEVGFNVPDDITIAWKFVKDLKTIDLSFFKQLYIGQDKDLIIKKTTRLLRGTYLCEMYDENEVFVRKYFYIDVENVDLGPDTAYQKMFDTIVNSKEILEQHNAPSAGPTIFPSLEKLLRDPSSANRHLKILVVFGIMLVTLLVLLILGFLYVWSTNIH